MGLREIYQEKAEAQLCEWQTWIEQIKNDPKVFEMGGQVDRKRVAAQLDDCHRIARVRLAELCSSQNERWEVAKQALERAMIDVKQALDRFGTGRAGRMIRLQDSRRVALYPFDRKG